MICSHHPPPLGKTYPPLNRPNPPKNCYWSQSPLTEDFLITPVPPPPLNTGGSHYEMAFAFDRKALEAVRRLIGVIMVVTCLELPHKGMGRRLLTVL